MHTYTFLCFVTKAVHLEAVSILPSEAFLAALRRFIERRRHCTTLYSVCGTNYKSAAEYLNVLHTQIVSELTQNEIYSQLAAQNIELKFPTHFGGIRKASIKSAKKL